MSVMLIHVPDQCDPYKDDIRRFVDTMIYKLKLHAHKGRWDDQTAESRIEKLKGEVAELEEALKGGNAVEIQLEAADVANYALIIASIIVERGK